MNKTGRKVARMTREQLVANAAAFAKEYYSRFKLRGKPKCRDTATIYFFCCGSNRNRARIEVQVDAKTGECIGLSLIPAESPAFDNDYLT